MPCTKSYGQYCSAASITETCNTSVRLNATSFQPWSYTWFETNAGGSNPVPLNGGAPATFITVAPNQTTYDEIHYYIEVGHRLYSPFLTCTSGVKAVKFVHELPIVSNNSSAPTYSLNNNTSLTYSNYQWYNNGSAIAGATSSSYSPTCSGVYTLLAKNPCNNMVTSNAITYTANLTITGGSTLPATLTGSSGYSNYQWYRNGQLIIGGTSSSYIATLPGEYYMMCLSFCGLSTSNTITLCGLINAPYSNTIFKGNTTISNTTLVLDGTIIIEGDASLTLSGCDVYMTAGSEIIVKKACCGQTHGGNLQLSYSNVYGCGKWGGIYAEGFSVNTANAIGSAQVSLSHSEIHDAYVGLFANNGAKLAVNYTVFENNFRHIDLRGFGGWSSSCTLGHGFNEGVSLTFSHNTFNSLMETAPSFTPTNLVGVSAPKNNSYRKQIYIDEGNTIILSNSIFNCDNWGNTQEQNAIEVYTIYGSWCNYRGFKIDHCTFNGDYNDAIMLTDANDVDISYNGISGDVNHGIEIFNGGGVNNGVYIDYNTIHNTNSTTRGISGVNISQVTNFNFTDNDVQHFSKGLEYYNLANQACVSASPACSTVINNNKFKYNRYGIVLAPEVDPIGTTAHHQSTSLTVTQMQKTNIFCNILYYNDYGIVGYGEINDLPFSNSGMASWGNKFAPRTTNSAVTSTSAYADIVYLYSGTPGNQPKIKHYSDSINILFSSPLKIFTSANNDSLDIEGVTVDRFNITSQLSFPSASYDACWSSFNKTDPTGFGSEFEKTEGLNVFPNPFSDMLTLENPYSEPVNYMIYNTLGEMVKQGTIKAATTETLGMENLASGCYYFKTYSNTSDLHVYTSKLFKAN